LLRSDKAFSVISQAKGLSEINKEKVARERSE